MSRFKWFKNKNAPVTDEQKELDAATRAPERVSEYLPINPPEPLDMQAAPPRVARCPACGLPLKS